MQLSRYQSKGGGSKDFHDCVASWLTMDEEKRRTLLKIKSLLVTKERLAKCLRGENDVIQLEEEITEPKRRCLEMRSPATPELQPVDGNKRPSPKTSRVTVVHGWQPTKEEILLRRNIEGELRRTTIRKRLYKGNPESHVYAKDTGVTKIGWIAFRYEASCDMWQIRKFLRWVALTIESGERILLLLLAGKHSKGKTVQPWLGNLPIRVQSEEEKGSNGEKWKKRRRDTLAVDRSWWSYAESLAITETKRQVALVTIGNIKTRDMTATGVGILTSHQSVSSNPSETLTMVGRRVIVAKPWNPSLVASTVESCSSTSSAENSGAVSSFFTTTGTQTIDTALREGSIPEMRCLTLPDRTTDSSDYDSSESEEVRESAGREVDPRDRDSIVVTISDRGRERGRRTGSEGSDRSNSGAGCAGAELYCLHRRPCAMGRTRSENTKQREVKVAGYEPVRIDRLENPPDSFTRRRSERHKVLKGQTSATVASIPQKSGEVVYRCRMPSDMSSPALSNMSQQSTAAPTVGIYENIDCFNQSNKRPVWLTVRTVKEIKKSKEDDPHGSVKWFTDVTLGKVSEWKDKGNQRKISGMVRTVLPWEIDAEYVVKVDERGICEGDQRASTKEVEVFTESTCDMASRAQLAGTMKRNRENPPQCRPPRVSVQRRSELRKFTRRQTNEWWRKTVEPQWAVEVVIVLIESSPANYTILRIEATFDKQGWQCELDRATVKVERVTEYEMCNYMEVTSLTKRLLLLMMKLMRRDVCPLKKVATKLKKWQKGVALLCPARQSSSCPTPQSLVCVTVISWLVSCCSKYLDGKQ